MSYLNVPDSYKQILGMTADDYAKQQTAGLNNQTQQYLSEYEKAAELRKNALNTNKQNTINQIQSQIPTIQEESKGQSKQAYINNMLSQRDVGQKLSQAGLNTTGVVGSTYSDLANSYNENLNTISSNRNKALREVENNVNNANLQYSQKEQELLADIESKKTDMTRYNNELANNRYQQAIDNYMKYKDYEKFVLQMNQQEDQIQASERQRAFENSIAQQQLELKKRQIEAEIANALSLSDKNNKSSSNNKIDEFANVDYGSVSKLGYGPLSKKRLDELTNKGKIIKKAINGQTTYEKTNNNENERLFQMWNRY
ncbi:MAG: hypothetical protein RR290_00735 [Clostridia bacterium]